MTTNWWLQIIEHDYKLVNNWLQIVEHDYKLNMTTNW